MRSIHLVSLVFVAACAADPTALSPRLPDRPSAVLLPPGAYPGAKVPFSGRSSAFLDVNDRLQMVGQLESDAILAEHGGQLFMLDKAGGLLAEVRAINSAGAAAGWILDNSFWQSPAIWDTPHSPPLLLQESGWVSDMNDRREAVGAVDRLGEYHAYYWEANTGLFTTLPLPRGAIWSRATGINNDRVIVGESSVGGVMWLRRSTGWTVTVLQGIDPLAVDAGYGTVGRLANQPVWGKPHYAGTLGRVGVANGIHRDGTISGGVATGLSRPLSAFVADRSGGMTMLPSPSAPGLTQATNSASCGFVVGHTYNQTLFTREAVYWDPGC